MSQSINDIEKKFAQLEQKFGEVEGLNQILAQQAKEYFLLFDSTRKLNSVGSLKELYSVLDKILVKNFNIDEFALILKNLKSDMLTVHHSLGLAKRKLKELFYRPNEGLVGKVFSHRKSLYIPDISEVRGFQYFDSLKNVKGSLYYLPVLSKNRDCLGVLKMRKVTRDGFSDVERAVFPNLQIEIGISISHARNLDLLNSNSYVDELTRLYNRNFFDDHFQVEFKRAQRYQHDLSLIFFDIDNFRKINRKYGYQEGDQILKSAGRLLQKITRSSDICIRYGSDDFVLLLPETSKKAAGEVAEKLKLKLEDALLQENGKLVPGELTFHTGMANYPQDTIEPHKLLEMAVQSVSANKKPDQAR